MIKKLELKTIKGNLYGLKVIFIIILLSVFLSVWGYTTNAENTLRLDFQLTNNIYLNSGKINDTLFLYESDIDLSSYSFISECKINSKFIWNEGKYYLFKITYIGNTCDKNTVSFVAPDSQIIRTEPVTIIEKPHLYDYFLDYSTWDLEELKNTLTMKREELTSSLWNTPKLKLKQARKVDEINYLLWLINYIVLQRDEKYIVPVLWKSISNNVSRVPNARRPYRKDITDGIHHWWDVYWPLEDQTVAIDDALVVRVVRDFEYSDLWKLNRSSVLSELDEAKNLDIYRWNQVWLKTMKWDLVFYSHLTEISDTIVEWEIIKQGDFVWTTGITGVPDKNYSDYHLHFTIHKNPYIRKKAWKNTIDDYLLWDWYFKWKSISYVLQNQNKIFKDYD